MIDPPASSRNSDPEFPDTNEGHSPVRRFQEAWKELRRLGVTVDSYTLLHHARQCGGCETAGELIEFLHICRSAPQEAIPEEQKKYFLHDVQRALEKLMGPMSSSGMASAASVASRSPASVLLRGDEAAASQQDTEASAGWSLLYCAACGTLNPGSKNFCTSCGTALWRNCPNCGTKTPVTEPYCGDCGFPVGKEVETALRECKEKLEKADQLLAQHRPAESLVYLEEVLNGQYAWLQADFRRRATQLKQQAETQLAEQTKLAESLLRQAEEAAQAGHFDQALQILDQVPPGVHSNRCESARQRYLTAKKELHQLELRLQALLREKNVRELIGVIRTILELYPAHAQARQTAQKLLPHWKQTIRALQQKHQYRSILKLLEQFPAEAWDQELVEVEKKVKEILGTQSLLTGAAYRYPYLEEVFARLKELLPSESPVAATAEKVLHAAKRRTIPNNGWTVPLRKSSESRFGPVVQWVCGFRRICLADSCDPQPLQSAPGMFLAAAGAALQGLGLTRLSINCLQQESFNVKRFLNSVTSFVSSRPISSWGFDFGWSSVKGVRLEYTPSKKQVRLTHLDWEPYSKPLHHAAAEGQTGPILLEAFRRLVSRMAIQAHRVVLALPSNMVLFQTRLLPPADREKLETLLQYEVRRLFPKYGENLTWSFDLWKEIPQELPGLEGMPSQVQAVLCVAARPLLIDFLHRIRAMGVDVDIVISDALALCHWYEADFLSPPADSDSSPESAVSSSGESKALPVPNPSLLVDIGAGQSKAIYLSEDQLRLYTLGLAADALIRSFVQELKLTFSNAEKALRQWNFQPSYEKLFCLEQFWQQSASDMHRLFDQLQTDHLPLPKSVLVCGGGACIPGLLDYWMAPASVSPRQ